MTGATCSPETSVDFQRTTCHCIPGERALHNLKVHILTGTWIRPTNAVVGKIVYAVLTKSSVKEILSVKTQFSRYAYTAVSF
jgi:hypothetical protein